MLLRPFSQLSFITSSSHIFQIIGDTYAAIAIRSFFALLCHYVGGTSEDQEAFFRDLVPGGWALYIFGFSIPLPVHWVCGKNMAKPSGSRWFKVIAVVKSSQIA